VPVYAAPWRGGLMGNEMPKVAIRTMRWSQNISKPGSIRRLMESGEKAFFIMRERHWKKEFKKFELTLLAKDVRRRAIRINGELIRSIKEDGLSRTFKNYNEDVVLLTNH